jgi:hypothetical protein
LVPFRTSEQARAAGQRSGRARRAKAALRRAFPTRLSTADWDVLFVERAFTDLWRAHYRQRKRALRRHYVGAAGDAKVQYQILTEHIAQLDTLVAQGVADHADPAKVAHLRHQLRDWIAQLQKYTEAEQQVAFLVNNAQVTVLEHVIAIAEYEIYDLAILGRFLGALRRAVETAALGNDGVMRKLLTSAPEPASSGVIERGPTRAPGAARMPQS